MISVAVFGLYAALEISLSKLELFKMLKREDRVNYGSSTLAETWDGNSSKSVLQVAREIGLFKSKRPLHFKVRILKTLLSNISPRSQ